LKFLRDTNILGAIATRKRTKLTERIIQTTRSDLRTSDVVWHKVQFGFAAIEAIALKLRPIYTILFEGLHALPTTQAVWTRAANSRAELS
jgi:predicted nucleic acid-binding protein